MQIRAAAAASSQLATGVSPRCCASRASVSTGSYLAACRICRSGGWVGAVITISCARREAPAIRGAINDASGRFRQYFTGISAFMAFTFSRAGLKILA